MNLTAETTAQRLAQSVRQFNKAFMQFNRTELHQSFAGCKPSEFGVLFIIIIGRTAGYDAIQEFVNGVQIYLRSKGWA